MVRLLFSETEEGLSELSGDERVRHVSLATGKLIAPSLRQIIEKIREKFPGIQANVIPVENHFFGELITVSGLITGQDLIEQLRGRDLGEELLLPLNMFRSGESVMLDDVTAADVAAALQIKVRIVESGGKALLSAVIGAEGLES
jgi:NifB/MoaA-like Fe-S oxidoreductase